MKNINNFACLVDIDGAVFQCDFDHKSIDILESVTGIGFYSIYDNFVLKNNFSNKDTINLLSVSAFKHHGAEGMQKLKCKLIAHPEISLNQLATFKLHFKNLLPDLVKFQKDLKFINPKAERNNKKNPDFYNFEDNYALAKNYLGWSDETFWLATPKKLCFAFISLAKFDKEKSAFAEKQQFQNSIHLLNGIKKLL